MSLVLSVLQLEHRLVSSLLDKRGRERELTSGISSSTLSASLTLSTQSPGGVSLFFCPPSHSSILSPLALREATTPVMRPSAANCVVPAGLRSSDARASREEPARRRTTRSKQASNTASGGEIVRRPPYILRPISLTLSYNRMRLTFSFIGSSHVGEIPLTKKCKF